MTCTVAAIVAFLGAMPPKGTIVIVPRSQVSQLSFADRAKAEACAFRYGIRWRIDKSK